MCPPELRDVLPEQTSRAWPKVVAALPVGAYLAGGTAVALHLGHRVSHELGIFVPSVFNSNQVRRTLAELGDLTVTNHTADTLSGVIDGARVQFLEAAHHRQLDRPSPVESMPVAGLRDLMADKLKVIGDRGELRDYFDLMMIEARSPHRCEHGLRYYRQRYGIGAEHVSLTHITRSLSHFGDVADDPGLPMPRGRIEAYWRSRQPELLSHLRSQTWTHGQHNGSTQSDRQPDQAGRCGAPTTRGGTCMNPSGSCPHHG